MLILEIGIFFGKSGMQISVSPNESKLFPSTNREKLKQEQNKEKTKKNNLPNFVKLCKIWQNLAKLQQNSEKKKSSRNGWNRFCLPFQGHAEKFRKGKRLQKMPSDKCQMLMTACCDAFTGWLSGTTCLGVPFASASQNPEP